MAVEQWLPLTDYASKYRISVSTLRRRIKNEQIKHRFDDGKYMLLDLIPDQLDHGFTAQQPLEPVLSPISAADFLRNLGFAKPQQEFDVAGAANGAQTSGESEDGSESVTTQKMELDSHEPRLDSLVSSQPETVDSQPANLDIQKFKLDTHELKLDTHELTLDSQVDSQIPSGLANATPPADEPLLTSATRLLSELKRAYMNILQEKEESIIQLKKELSDVKTLCRVLEDDNERMRKFFAE